jgi:hypothetical protein
MKNNNYTRWMLVAAIALIAVWWILARNSGPLPSAVPNTVAAPSSPVQSANHISAVPENGIRWQEVAVLTARLANPVEQTTDLSATYERYVSSESTIERSIAYRAWGACFPTFMGSDGQPVSVDTIARGLAANSENNAKRIAAYTDLRRRCEGFFRLGRDEILHASQRQLDAHNRGDIVNPGDLAMKHFLEGRADEALDVAKRTLESGDPYAIASLQEYLHRVIAKKIDEQQLPRTTRSDLSGLAVVLAACQLGWDCAANSLTALQQCANTGLCDATVSDRYLQALPNAKDRELALVERDRTLEAIRSKNYASLALE